MSSQTVVTVEIKLRAALVPAMREMYETARSSRGPQTGLSYFLGEIVECAVAQFKTVRLADERIPTGRPVEKPVSRGGPHSKLNAAERERVLRLSIEHGLKPKEIAGRFGAKKISVQLIRRILWERKDNEEGL